jgi:thiamine biosynthesis protein ThiS
VKLSLNGETREVPPLETLADLATHLGLPAFGSAIELNGEVIARYDHSRTPLREGDRLEVIRLVGGG